MPLNVSVTAEDVRAVSRCTSASAKARSAKNILLRHFSAMWLQIVLLIASL